MLTFTEGNFADFFTATGLTRLDSTFQAAVAAEDPELARQFADYRAGRIAAQGREASALLLALAPILEAFLARFFGIEADNAALQQSTRGHDPVMAFKK
ncbi:hypothetical protein HF288_02880, partial [Acidithiobacillus caldus]|nr:hypothetical protein [Acidithiobacillus caldus]